jgi:RHS repeat-associated protein
MSTTSRWLLGLITLCLSCGQHPVASGGGTGGTSAGASADNGGRGGNESNAAGNGGEGGSGDENAGSGGGASADNGGRGGDESNAAGNGGQGGSVGDNAGNGGSAGNSTENGGAGAAGMAGSGGVGGAAATPPDPATVAPPLDRTVATDVFSATVFLYSGVKPIQTGVEPGTIVPTRAAVLRGLVTTRDGNPLPAVQVSILHHPEFGQTLSRMDGAFDLVVNGGDLLTVNYTNADFLPAQRQVQVPWQDYAHLPTVALVPLDSEVTPVTLNSGTMQVAQGSVMTDSDGSRRSTLLFPAGTAATMTLPDGSTQSLSSLQVRATEYTVGPNGPRAMPGQLPPSSGYTYAVELSADEALAANATSLQFNQPVVDYIENFIHIPVGGIVPVGFYDREKSAWIPVDNGRVIQITGITQGLADVDSTGGGTLPPLILSDAERDKLASLYSVGQTLWRVPIPHFTSFDSNWPFGFPKTAERPSAKSARPRILSKPCKRSGGSTLECENQTLGEGLFLIGTPFELNYRSDRTPGRKDLDTVQITLTKETVPAGLKRIELSVFVAGREFDSVFAPTPNQSTTFTWDRKDVYGRVVQGAQHAMVTLGYVYDAVYETPADLVMAFGLPGDGHVLNIPGGSANRAALEVTLSVEQGIRFGSFVARDLGLGGWTLSVHHFYDPVSNTLYLGTGERRDAFEVASVITTVAGNGGLPRFGGDGGPAKQAQLFETNGTTMAPDGSLYIADSNNQRIRRVDPSGVITTIAGTGSAGFGGDGGRATQAQLNGPIGLALAPDGNLYIAESANQRIRRVDPSGIITTVAGNGVLGFGGDGGPATQAKLNGPRGLAVAPDGSLYIADTQNSRIRRVGPSGIITTVAGDGVAAFSGDGGPATQARLSLPTGLAVAPDGALYFADQNTYRIRRVDPSGIITTVAGNGTPGFSGDGGPATQAAVSAVRGLSGLAVAPDGSLYIADSNNQRIRRVDPSGVITIIAGNGIFGLGGDGGPATQAEFRYPTGIVLAPDGTLYFADSGNNRIRHITSPLPGILVGDFAVASEDGRAVYEFDSRHRHARTRDALSGATLYQFSYDAAGNLTGVTDGDGNLTTVERDGDGKPTAIVAPFGQRTALSVDSNGDLAQLTDPAGGTCQMAYTNDGLLTAFTDPNGHSSAMTYDAMGRLTLDTDAARGSKALALSGDDADYTVALATSLQRTTRYRVASLSTGDVERTIQLPDGTKNKLQIGTDGTRKTTRADGTVSTLLQSPDPRFGMDAPLESLTTTTGGLTSTVTNARTVNLSDPTNLFSLTTSTDTTVINGRKYTRAYNASTRTFTMTSPAGRTSAVTIDKLGRVTGIQVGGLAPVTAEYDTRGRLANLVWGMGSASRTTAFHYNAAGFLESSTDPLGHSLGYAYDAAGRLTQETRSDGQTTAYAYDPSGNVFTVAPPGRPAHGFTYNEINQIVAYEPPPVPGDGSTLYTYDLDHKLNRTLRPDGEATDFDYDAAGRLITKTFSTSTVTSAYDAVGRLSSIADDAETLALSYGGSLLTGTTLSGTVSGSVSYTYDNDFALSSIAVNGANPVTLTYDTDKLLTGAGALTLKRDPQNGLLTGTTLGAVTDTISRNTFGDLAEYHAQANGTDVFSLQLTRDSLGRITRKVETIAGSTATFDYSYDVAGRLQEVAQNGTVSSVYTYDANGNRLSGPSTSATAAYDAQDRLVSFAGATYSYAPNGELQAKTAGVKVTTYEYDVLGNLKAVTLPDGTTVSYVIDGNGRRTGKIVNGVLVQGLLYQDQLKPIAELDSANTIVSRFVYATSANVPDYMVKGGITYRVVTDALGSPRLVVNTADGSVVQRMDYDEFGVVSLDSNPGFQPFGFAGGLYDPETTLVHFGARDYDAKLGRWTTKDPMRFGGRDTNLYAYAFGNPIDLSDATGTSVKVCWSSPWGFGGPSTRELAHWWLETDTQRRGMGNPRGGIAVEWVGQNDKYRTFSNPGEIQCMEKPDTDDACVNNNTTGDLGYWTPFSTCQDAVNRVLDKCYGGPSYSAERRAVNHVDTVWDSLLNFIYRSAY